MTLAYKPCCDRAQETFSGWDCLTHGPTVHAARHSTTLEIKFPTDGEITQRDSACCRDAAPILHDNGFAVAWHCPFHGNIARTGYEPAVLEMPLTISIGKRPLRDILSHQLEMYKRFRWKLAACALNPDVYFDALDSVYDRIQDASPCLATVDSTTAG